MLRLQTRPQFQVVLDGVVVSRTQHFALHARELSALSLRQPEAMRPVFHPSGTWLGAMVPKRWARRAVTRNTIKRQIYSVAAEYAPTLLLLAPMGHVVRLRTSWDRAEYISATSDKLRHDVRQELQVLFSNAQRRLADLAATPSQLATNTL
ncbi:ribonuclease P protein component [Curvibacter sp. CHRR-16]|uniref:ribonuclease P protein component n=1 Tax=Curvibacter sp. CHRR-16 TaxID=2835872 RepID=UPI001BD95903|nr:ribonuclease P protein component [Curvibacter sp. CHRR-16]MBT0570323.1 ribonuclease P protein component [Curvibacter sp. CHRR-16]